MPRFFVKKPQLTDIPEKEEGNGFKFPVEIKDKEDGGQENLKTFLSWKAPSRPYRKKDRSYYTTVAIIVIILILILILINEFMLIGAILALVFVVYVLGFIPPDDVEYKISGQGITIEGHFYFWDDLDSFWFMEKEGQKLLSVLTHLRFPAQLIIHMGDTSEEEVKKIMAKFIPFHEIAPKTLMDKWSEGLQKHLTLENPHR